MNDIRRRIIPLESWVLLNPPAPGRLPPELLPSARLAPPPIPRVRDRGFTLIAWMVIILVVGLVATLQAFRGELEMMMQENQTVQKTTGKKKKKGEQDIAPLPVDPVPLSPDPVSDAVTEMQVRYLIGGADFLKQDGGQFLSQLKMLQAGSSWDKLKYAVYAGELIGPKEALKELSQIRRKARDNTIHLNQAQWRTLDILNRLYGDYNQLRFDAPSVTPADRAFLKMRLDWAGELALVPKGTSVPNDLDAVAGNPITIELSAGQQPNPDKRAEVLEPARRTFMTTIASFGGVLCIGFLGLIGLVVVGVMVSSGKMRGALRMTLGNSGIYAETFALWLILFLGLNIALHIALPNVGTMLVSIAGFLLSLSALFWPMLRGISWSDIRQEIGWTGGTNPLREVLWGFAWYAMSLPFLVVGLIITLLLMFIKDSLTGSTSSFALAQSTPSSHEAAHPIIGEIANADWTTLVLIFFVASVVAPIVEETMFRGVLYRHMRELTGRWGSVFWSFLISALVVSFIFAAIHPQGVLAIPVLMALAFGFTLAREFRGSLISCMVAHGISNGLVLAAAVNMIGGS